MIIFIIFDTMSYKEQILTLTEDSLVKMYIIDINSVSDSVS